MAYSTSNPPAKLAGLTDQTQQNWVYKSVDVAADVDTDGYITNADDLGMRVGDKVDVFDTTTPASSTHYVAAINANGSADLFDGVVASVNTD